MTNFVFWPLIFPGTTELVSMIAMIILMPIC